MLQPSRKTTSKLPFDDISYLSTTLDLLSLRVGPSRIVKPGGTDGATTVSDIAWERRCIASVKMVKSGSRDLRT